MIVVEHLVFDYPGLRALDDVSVTIQSGAVVALVGPAALNAPSPRQGEGGDPRGTRGEGEGVAPSRPTRSQP